jgi:hypothetical protein
MTNRNTTKHTSPYSYIWGSGRISAKSGKAIEKNIYLGTAAVRKNLDIDPPYDSERKLVTTKAEKSYQRREAHCR